MLGAREQDRGCTGREVARGALTLATRERKRPNTGRVPCNGKTKRRMRSKATRRMRCSDSIHHQTKATSVALLARVFSCTTRSMTRTQESMESMVELLA